MYAAEIHHFVVHGHAAISSHVSQLLLQFDGLYESRSCTFDVCKSLDLCSPILAKHVWGSDFWEETYLTMKAQSVSIQTHSGLNFDEWKLDDKL
jgi:hypothetical protein